MQEFLNRCEPFFGEQGLDVLAKKTIAISGLGGVGGGTFLALVRCGCSDFRLAENGIFDPPDMNRQAAAFGHSMDRPKLEVYVELARSINPDLVIRTWPEGITTENMEKFIQGADAYIGVIDAEKGADVKAMTPAILQRHNVAMFTAGVIGFGAIMINYNPEIMTDDEFFRLVKMRSKGEPELLPSFLTRNFSPSVIKRFQQGLARSTTPTTAIGGLASNALLANEVVIYLLKNTDLVEREAIFAPRFVTLDFMTLEMKIDSLVKSRF